MTLFDAIDIKIFAVLRRDARTRLTTLAKLCDIPTSTVYDRIVRFRKLGVRFTPLLAWSELGCSLTVCLVAPFNESLVQHANVNTCVRVSPNAMFLECVFASMRELDDFRTLVPHARAYPVIEILKNEGFVPEQDPVPL